MVAWKEAYGGARETDERMLERARKATRQGPSCAVSLLRASSALSGVHPEDKLATTGMASSVGQVQTSVSGVSARIGDTHSVHTYTTAQTGQLSFEY